MEPARKRAQTGKETRQSVVFITCAVEGQDFTTNDDLRGLLNAVRNALEAGAKMINIAFSKVLSGDLVDTCAILPKLKPVFEGTWRGSVNNLHILFVELAR